eukprot:6209454-Pleurochrysis_carterae.AAC.3
MTYCIVLGGVFSETIRPLSSSTSSSAFFGKPATADCAPSTRAHACGAHVRARREHLLARRAHTRVVCTCTPCTRATRTRAPRASDARNGAAQRAQRKQKRDASHVRSTGE